MVGGHSVTFEQDFVVEVECVDAYPAANAVFKLDLFVAGHLRADYIGIACVQSARNLVFGQREAVFHCCTRDTVVLPVGVSGGFGSLANRFKFFGRVKRAVGVAGG